MSLDYVPADIWSEVLGYCDRSALPSYCLVSTNLNLGATAALYRSISLNTKRARQFCDNASHRIPLIRHLKAFIYVNGHSEHSLRDEDTWLSLLRGLKAASALQTLDIMGRSEIHSLPMTTPAIVNMLVSFSDLPSLRNVSSKLHFPSKYGTPDIVTCWGALLKGLTLSTDQHLCPLVWDKTPPHPSHRPKLKTLICYGLPSPWNDVEKFFDLGSVSHFAIIVRSSTFIPHDTISNNIVDALKTSTDRLETFVISSKSRDMDDSNLLLPTDFKVFFPSLTTLAIFGSEISTAAQFSALLTFIQCITSQSPSLATLKLHFHVDEYEIYLPSYPSWIIPPSHPSWITARSVSLRARSGSNIRAVF
ncbi:hypothetical protein DL96DRAFT_986659 [Flagelloscypha sp. PMI_526]|nr:hypothetical protein DL96DRAFT_986659 [Flagelloscypha sp. PMI_526]